MNAANLPPLRTQIVVVEKRIGSTAGILSVIFGLLGIYTLGFLFVPLAFIAALVALFKGQIVLGLLGMLLTIVAALTSPSLWAVFGLSALWILSSGS